MMLLKSETKQTEKTLRPEENIITKRTVDTGNTAKELIQGMLWFPNQFLMFFSFIFVYCCRHSFSRVFKKSFSDMPTFHLPQAQKLYAILQDLFNFLPFHSGVYAQIKNARKSG